MKSYFFVPATKLHKIPSVLESGADKVIIDLEDAVSFADTPEVAETLMEDSSLTGHFVRVPVIDPLTGQVDVTLAERLKRAGFHRFMLPKLRNFSQFEMVAAALGFDDDSLILLVENPSILMEIPKILSTYPGCLHGIGMGSHDYVSETGAVHNLANLEFPRQWILSQARVADILAIDIASMEINDMDVFTDEVTDGFLKGYDAKLLIHPRQLQRFNQIDFYTAEEYQWAKAVLAELDAVNGIEHFRPVVIGGIVVERPHLKRAAKIAEWYQKKYENQNPVTDLHT